MNLLAEHKTSLKYYAALFLLFGFILLLCGALFENENSELGKHQETMYRQDQVHYWAGIPVSTATNYTECFPLIYVFLNESSLPKLY